MITLQEVIENDWAIHCSTETEAVRLFEELDKRGIIWISDEKLTKDTTLWEDYGIKTVYRVMSGTKYLIHSDAKYQIAWGNIVVEFTDLFAPYGYNLRLSDIGTVKVSAPKLTLIGCIEAIYSNKDITVVLFDDGKKIKVKRAKDDKGSIYSAVAYALAEHIYGSNTAFKKVVDSKLRSK
jgi:hypothetical protein